MPYTFSFNNKFALPVVSVHFVLVFLINFLSYVQVKCIDEVERRGLSEVGIYRVPG